MLGVRTFRFLGAAALSSVALLASGSTHATVVERVVAVIGERPILLSELRRRAAPFASGVAGSESTRARARGQLYEEMLQRMIDEELIRNAANQAQLKVTQEEVDAAVERVARGNQVSVGELLAEVERSGVSAADYRRELRSQLLDAKVMNVRLQGRVRVSEEEMRTEYQKLLSEEQRQLPLRLAVIRLGVASDASSTRAQALQVAQRARLGADFAQLSRDHSADEPTRTAGGLLAPVTPAELPSQLRQVLSTMQIGDVSDPVRVGDTWVVLKLVDRAPSSLPPFDDVLPQLQQRVQLRKMEKARRIWLDAVRKTTHVEVRL